ncbi:MAG TPA: efflux RND transporter periplasmic adaptor subunit [Thermoanaerobaculia bacterium]|nr:efflux RND transporter periplasmic adaptor subunit [Thermoanaerobaculia bacterium]
MKLWRTAPATLAALALAAAACGGRHETKEAAPPPVTAALATAEAAELPDRVELYGTVEAAKTAAISSRVMANVVAVPVRTGDLVAEGAVLVEIDPATAKGQEAQAKGALAQARAALALSDRNYQRFQALAASGSASDLELDMARMQYEQARGAVQQAEGAVEAASSVSRESRVTAPFAGRVAARMVDPGDFAAPGRPLVVLESATGRRLAVAVPASTTAASGLKAGQTVSVRLDGAPAEVPGAVAEMSPGADPASHTFTAKIELAGAPAATGLTGRAFVRAAVRKTVLVPAAAVVQSGGLPMVVVRDAEGKARSRAVTTGAAQDGTVEILSGLSGGETVLVSLKTLPADGAPVREAAK